MRLRIWLLVFLVLGSVLVSAQTTQLPSCVQPNATLGTTGGRVCAGTGSPEGALVGWIGDIYVRRDGGAGTTVYAKESGSATNTGWVSVPSVSTAARTVLDDATVAAMVDTLGGAASSGTGGLVRATSPSIDTPTVNTSLTVTDDDWIGLGAAKGRVEFDDTTVDELNILDANVGIGTATPEKALHVTSSAESVIVDGTATWGAAMQFRGGGSARTWQFQSTGTGAGEGANKFLVVDKSAGDLTRLAIDGTGNIGIGTLTPGGGSTLGTGVLSLTNGIAPVGGVANQVSLFSADAAASAELFALDEAGNTPQLTPHNFTLFTPESSEPYPWSYYSANDYLGVEIGVDMAKMARLVEKLTGEQLVYIRQHEPKADWATEQAARVEREIPAYDAWLARKSAATKSGKSFDEKAPPVPQVRVPPQYLLERLKAMGREPDLTAIQTELAAWKTANGVQ